MTDAKVLLSDELLKQVDEAARAQHRKPSEVLEDAVRQYLEDRSWARLIEYGRERAKSVGITTEEGIDSVIAESRREQRER